MIVVAIIGILAAIAIPNFLRYQLRAKFSELKTNVEAIYKSEESLRQSERVLCPAPRAASSLRSPRSRPRTPGASKTVWAARDLVAASSLDWVVQGGTYGVYAAATDAPPAAGRHAVTCAARSALSARRLPSARTSDIDGDTAGSLTCLFQRPLDSRRGPRHCRPGCTSSVYGRHHSTTARRGTAAAGNVGDGQVTNCSADNIF